MVYVKVVNRFNEQTNNTARLRLENVYFTFYGGRKQVTTKFFFLPLNLDMAHGNLTTGEFVCLWQIKGNLHFNKKITLNHRK